MYKIIKTKENTIEAVVVVMMCRFDMSDTLQTVVMDINCLVMHVQRRQYRHRQIGGQQQDRCNMSEHAVIHFEAQKYSFFYD
ncbi:MAG: hypothetical protein K5650_07390 [Bacteroidales bacterium]|nr:hypothetical protein [Bacteroidales bacterium]